MPDGTPFPFRDLAITVAVGVILLSLLIAAVGLPLLLRGHPVESEADAELVRARRMAIDAAIGAIEKHHSGDGEPTKFLIAAYRGRSNSLDDPRDADERAAWRNVYRTALHAERRAVQKLRAADIVDDTVARQLLSELDLLEAALMLRPLRPHSGDS